MATKKTTRTTTTERLEIPKTLNDNPFFGIKLDEEQKHFRDSIWNDDKLIVFCNAPSGTGKTTIAFATAELLYQYGKYEGIVYVTAPVQEERIGFLPGTAQEKTAIYAEPLMQAAVKIGVNTFAAIVNDNIAGQKNGTAYIECLPHNYLRGCNFENKVVIIDEAQNYYGDELKKVLTRIHDTCKTIVIGHTGQIDLYHKPQNSGFAPYIEHFINEPWCEVCNLTKNYRGLVSRHADTISF